MDLATKKMKKDKEVSRQEEKKTWKNNIRWRPSIVKKKSQREEGKLRGNEKGKEKAWYYRKWGKKKEREKGGRLVEEV